MLYAPSLMSLTTSPNTTWHITHATQRHTHAKASLFRADLSSTCINSTLASVTGNDPVSMSEHPPDFFAMAGCTCTLPGCMGRYKSDFCMHPGSIWPLPNSTGTAANSKSKLAKLKSTCKPMKSGTCIYKHHNSLHTNYFKTNHCQ